MKSVMKWLGLILTLCLLFALVIGGYVWLTSDSIPAETRGFVRKIFADQHGQAHEYMVYVPYDYMPGQKRPLLMLLPHRTTALDAISSYFGPQVWEMARTFPFVVVVPQCSPGRGWDRMQIDKAIVIMDQVAADYETDPDKVYVTGVSAGGNGVWNIIVSHPDRFAAAVPQCGVASIGYAETLADKHIPIWNSYYDGDSAGLIEANRKMRQSLLDAGASPITTEYPQEGHDCSHFVYRCAGMYDWLLEQSRSKNARQTRRFELLSVEQMLATWESYGANGWRTAKDGSLEYDGAIPDQPGYLVSKKAYDACEFHFDVFLESEASVCRLGLFDTVSNNAMHGYTLTLLLPNSGDGDLMHSASGWIASVDPAAQHQLRCGHWNDIRVHFGNGRINVRINGWKAMDAPMQKNGDRPFRVAIISPDIKSGVRWRNVRARVPN